MMNERILGCRFFDPTEAYSCRGGKANPIACSWFDMVRLLALHGRKEGRKRENTHARDARLARTSSYSRPLALVRREGRGWGVSNPSLASSVTTRALIASLKGLGAPRRIEIEPSQKKMPSESCFMAMHNVSERDAEGKQTPAVTVTPPTSALPLEAPPPFAVAISAARPPLEPPVPKRTGVGLWKVAQHRVKGFHAVQHQLQHRAAEKVCCGVAGRSLEHGAKLFARQIQPASRLAYQPFWQRMLAQPRRALGTALCRLRAIGRGDSHCTALAAAAAPPPPSLPALAGARMIEGCQLMLPLAAACLLSHMAQHDWHRLQKERRVKGPGLAVALFALALLADVLDALAHAVCAACASAHAAHVTLLPHETEHTLHDTAFGCALVATASMVAGELLSARAAPAPPSAAARVVAMSRSAAGEKPKQH